MPRVVCDQCGKKTTKKSGDIRRWKLHFCNRKCYNAYRSKFRYAPYAFKTDTSHLRKIKEWAKLYAEKQKDKC